MIIKTKRSEVPTVLEGLLSKNNKVIVTGLDGSGKSYILKEFYPKYYIMKFDDIVSDAWMECKDIKWLSEYYQLYDRHTLIDYPVYDKVRLILEGKDHSKSFEEFVDLYKNEYKKYKAIVFIHDKYWKTKHDNDFAENNRSMIRDSFLEFINLIKDKLDIYLVED